MRKKALITGITGQDGSYLAELLLSKGHDVHGMVRRVAIEDPLHRMWRIRHVLDKTTIHSGSLENYPTIFHVVESLQPDDCYHLAAHSFVSYSFDDEFFTLQTNINGTHAHSVSHPAEGPVLPVLFRRFQRDVWGCEREPPK